MKNPVIDSATKVEIDKTVDRIQRDLGISDGRVVLAEVRDLLDLDLRYYSMRDPGLLEEVVHKVRLGGKQILKRPTLLLDVVRKFDLSALFVPDRKRILLDADIPDLKKRWNEAHEIAHSLLPWHREYLHGDTKTTLSPSCHEQIECEANYAAGRLIFPHASLLKASRSSGPSLAHVKAIALQFGNTITSALWRYVELCDFPCAAIIGAHPQHELKDSEAAAYFVQSAAFSEQFNNVSDSSLLGVIRSYCSYKRGGPLGQCEFPLVDDRGDGHIFLAESFGNSHQVLTLVSVQRSKSTRARESLVA